MGYQQPRRDIQCKELKLPRGVAVQALSVAKALKIPLARLIAESVAAYARERGYKEVSDAPGPTENPNDLCW